jgi:hypothetical protein
MSVGPVEYIVIQFPGNQFKGEIAPELQRLVQSDTIRIIDLVFIAKDAEGNVLSFEIDGIDGEVSAAYMDVETSLESLLNDDDIAIVAADLEPNSSAALMVWENVWAGRFAEAIMNAGGQVLVRDHVPYEAVLAARDALTAG